MGWSRTPRTSKEPDYYMDKTNSFLSCRKFAESDFSCGERGIISNAACAGHWYDRDLRSDFCPGFHPGDFFVTRDPFLGVPSNIMALLGLRSLYFALAGLVDRFRYLRHRPWAAFWR